MKAAICQKHCEKLWGIHWKQMGFFSFNSEILSLSGTIKINRGATQNVIKQELARLSLCPWAFPRGPAWGRDGAVEDSSGTSPAPPAPPLGYQQVLQTGGRGAGESALGARVPASFGAPKRRSENPISRRERGGLRGTPTLGRSPHPLLSFGARTGVPSPPGFH